MSVGLRLIRRFGSRLRGVQFDLLACVPEGLEDVCEFPTGSRPKLFLLAALLIIASLQIFEDELREKCSNVEVLWVGRGAVRFSTTTRPGTVMACMRSVHQLVAYIHHMAPFDNVCMSAADVADALKPPFAANLAAACRVWQDVPAADGLQKHDPVEKNDSTTYRMTTERRGKQKFTSMDVSREAADAVEKSGLKWKAKMRGMDIEILITILDDQLWTGIALHSGLISCRNRTNLGLTTLSCAVCVLKVLSP